MESGALDGKLFSTSYMFEKYANWTALHVGKYKHSSFQHVNNLLSNYYADIKL